MKRRRAFTLVELLVVVGVIAVLMSILLPMLSRVRESADAVKCSSNLRQLTSAFLMYATHNEGRFPGPAAGAFAHDWIHWEVGRDREKGAIQPYLGPFNPEVYRCPADDVNKHWFGYQYSYSANYLITNLLHAFGMVPPRTPQVKLMTVVHPSTKMLLVDESHQTVDDGCWAWLLTLGDGRNVMSNRHDRSRETSTDLDAGRGNASFVDGHVEFIERRTTFDPRYCDPMYRGT